MVITIYKLLVNKQPGIKYRYHNLHDGSTGVMKLISWLYLLWLNFAYYFLFMRFLGKMPEVQTYESKRIPGIVSLVVEKEDFHNERFIKKISEEVALSTGSACSAGEPSYVIQALGLGDKVTKVLRVSINKFTTESDINEFIKLLRAEI